MAIKKGDKIPAPQFQSIPNELKRYPNFLLWKAKSRKDKPDELTKVPVTVEGTGFYGWNDPLRLYTFEVVEKAFRSGNFDGIGFALAGTDFICIDLDNTVSTANISKELTNLTAFGYTEISPSGKGYHIWLRGRKPEGMGKNGHTSIGEKVEVFGDSGWVTVTGNVYHAAPIQENQSLINKLNSMYFTSNDTANKTIKPALSPANIPDLETIKERMFNGHKGKKIQALWNGDTREYNADHSRADQALCNYLAFYAEGDFNTIDILFRQSGLYRSKWDERRGSTTYGGMTIKKAINSISKVHRESYRTDIPPTDQQPVATEIQQSEEKVSSVPSNNDEKYETLLARMDSLEQLLFGQQKYIDMKLDERDRKMMESIRQSQEEQKAILKIAAAVQEEKKKSLFARLFGK